MKNLMINGGIINEHIANFRRIYCIKNNIVKKIPKDFSSSFVAEIYNENSDETYKAYNEEYVEVEEQELEPVGLLDVGGVKVDAETGEVKSQPEF